MSRGFYKFGPGWGRQYIVANLDMAREEEIWLNNHGMRGFDGKLRAVVEQGSKPGDFVRTFSLIFFVSAKVIEIFERHDFAIYKAGPVELEGAKHELPEYHWLAFCGKGGHIIPEECGITWGPPRPDGQPSIMRMERVVFDVNQWDGSDLFYLEELPGGYVVTERVKEALEKTKLTNCSLRRLEDVSF